MRRYLIPLLILLVATALVNNRPVTVTEDNLNDLYDSGALVREN